MAVKTITEKNFETEVIHSEKTILVDFFAPWCSVCKMVSPIIDQIGVEAVDFAVGKLDVDENPALSEKFGVMSVPTLVVFKNGKEVRRAVGAKSKSAIIEMINS